MLGIQFLFFNGNYANSSPFTKPLIFMFSPNKMTFTYTTLSPSMPALTMSPVKRVEKSLRPIASKPPASPSIATVTPTSSKFSKSTLKKERDRLLKKYSPMKKRSKLKFSPAKPEDVQSEPKRSVNFSLIIFCVRASLLSIVFRVLRQFMDKLKLARRNLQ